MTTPEIHTPASLLTYAQPSIDNANSLFQQSERAIVVTKDDFEKVIDAVKICVAQEKRADEALHKLIDPLTAHVDWIRQQFDPIFEALSAAKDNFKGKGLTWKQIEDKRLAVIAEEQRRLAEEQALRDAEDAAAAGDTERANNLLDMAASTPKQNTAVKGRGSFTGATGGSKKRWIGQVVDTKAFCAAVAAGDIPESYIKEISKSKLNTFADDKKTEGVFFGIRCHEEETLNVR